MNIKKKIYSVKFFRNIYFKYIRSFRNQRDINIFLLREFNFDVSLDIGANKGLYSFELEKISNNVVVFEPIRELYNDLKQNLKFKTRKYNFALGNKNEKNKIKIPIFKNSMSYGRASISEKFKKYVVKHIQVKKLDDLIKKKKIDLENQKVDFVKIDVEGHEYEVIKGSKIFFKEHNPITLIELSMRDHGRKKINNIFNFFNNLGYRSFYTNNGIKFKIAKEKHIKNFQNKKNYKKDILNIRRLRRGDRRY